MKAFNAILIGLMLILSVFAGASTALALDKQYGVPVSTFDDNNAKLTVDSIVIKDNAGTEWGSYKDVQSVTFNVPVGDYIVTAQKEGYTLAEENVKIEDGSPDVMPRISLFLTKEAVDNSQDNQGTDNGVTEPNMKIKLDINPDDKVKPGDEVNLDVEVEDRLVDTDGKGIDVDDVTVEVTVKDIDDGDDWEDEADIGDMDYKDEETQTFTFTVPYDADEDKYDVVIKATWEVDGKEYKNSITDTLEVEKEKHDVAITNAYLGSETVEPGKSTEIAVDLANIGKNDEDVRVKVESQDLGIEEWTAQFELKDGDTATQYITFTVPANAAAGKYFIHVNAYYNSGSDVDAEFVTLTVGGETAAATGAVSMTPVVTTVATGNGAGFTDDTFVVGGLIVGILVLLGVIAAVAKHVIPRKATIVESTRRKRR